MHNNNNTPSDVANRCKMLFKTQAKASVKQTMTTSSRNWQDMSVGFPRKAKLVAKQPVSASNRTPLIVSSFLFTAVGGWFIIITAARSSTTKPIKDRVSNIIARGSDIAKKSSGIWMQSSWTSFDQKPCGHGWHSWESVTRKSSKNPCHEKLHKAQKVS